MVKDEVKIEAGNAVAIDIGGTFIKSALVSSEGEVLSYSSIPTQASRSREAVVANIRRAYQEVDPGEGKVVGIGMGSPGCIDPLSGEVNWVENISCLNGISLTQALKKEINLPIYIDNDATNASKGEYLFGAGKGAKSLMAVTLGTGIGGGLILDGQVCRGMNNYSGEIGHMTYIPDGMACNCGKRGCLEAYASATAIVRSAESMIKRRLTSRLTELKPQTIDAQLVCDLARQGDEVCCSIIHDVGKALGVVIGSAINLLNLERILIGGGIAAAGDILFEPLRLYTSRHALPLALEGCEILPAALGNDAGLLGCAATVFLEMGFVKRS